MPSDADAAIVASTNYEGRAERNAKWKTEAEHRERQEKNLHRRAKELGYEWAKKPASDSALSS